MEGQMTVLQVDLSGKFADNVVSKINSSLDFYLPKVAQTIHEVRHLRNSTKAIETKILDRDKQTQDLLNQGFFLETTEGMDMQFKVNNTKTEVDYLKTMFGPETLMQMNKATQDIIDLQRTIDILKDKVDAAPTQDDITKLNKRFADYAKAFVVRDLKEDLCGFVKEEQFFLLEAEMGNLKKDMRKVAQRDEINAQINHLNKDIGIKLDDRPTKNYFNKHIGAQDSKIGIMENLLDSTVEKLDETQKDQDNEIIQLGVQIDKVYTEAQSKLDKNDAKDIWTHFQRFAEYKDLKDLYHKCLPEIAKFEQKIINFQTETEQHVAVLNRFDENLTQKCSKQALTDLYDYIQEKCILESSQNDFKEKVDVKLEEQMEKIKSQQMSIELLHKEFEDRIHQVVFKATMHLQGGSSLKDAASGKDRGMEQPSGVDIQRI